MARTRLTHAGVTYLAVDVEAWERDSTKVLEVGLAWVSAAGLTVHCRHLIVTDHLCYHNGEFVADNRAHFNFGCSEYVELSELNALLAHAVDEIATDGDVYLVGHSIMGDLRWLEGQGVDLGTRHLTICDVGQAHQARSHALQLTKLQKMMDELGMDYCDLHNAGNDAFYSVEVLRQMMASEERQRLEKNVVLE